MMYEKRMIAVHLDKTHEQSPLKAYDPIMLENVGGRMFIRKADPMTETPHAILNSDFSIDADGMILIPSWWYAALVKRYNAEHDHA